MQPREIPLKYKFPKREKQKLRTVWSIVSNLPATFSVLSKKSQLAKGTLSKYLKKLGKIEIIVKEINLYRLNDGLARNRNGKREILWNAIVNRWYHLLPEYQTLEETKVFREARRGRKELHFQAKVSDSAGISRRRKIDKIRKELLKKEPLG